MTLKAASPSIVGLLCGSGLLPLRVAQALKGKGANLVVIGIKGEADPEIEQMADDVRWTGLARLGQWRRIFRDAGVEVVLMVGAIRKRRMFRGMASLAPDLQSMKLWYERLRSKEDHTILEAVADSLEEAGLRVGSVAEHCPELLARQGCLTQREPRAEQWDDIRFAWPILKQVSALQIGQCLVVKGMAVIAVEGIDGTDATLRRGGRLAGGGAVAVKVAKEGHDPRFDLPCVGPDTVRVMAESGVAVLAVEADRTIMLDRELMARRAIEAGVCVLAISGDDIA
ncbi:MAG: UDP-2,3-diacylglucosamine diphosphatase LpxI [Planctomycetes bacterium]|nr:UDP-2,3-diacylglucosamine diphosphatase LpxI [Planctomycetota bacterium]